MIRVIDKKTKMFIRDDFKFDEKTEIGLDVKPSEGLYHPKWDGMKWIEGLTQTEIDVFKSKFETEKEPTTLEIMQKEIDALKAKLNMLERLPIIKTEIQKYEQSKE